MYVGSLIGVLRHLVLEKLPYRAPTVTGAADTGFRVVVRFV